MTHVGAGVGSGWYAGGMSKGTARLAEMEYLFLADYARLDSGLLTVAGAYIDTVTIPELPSMLPVAVVSAVNLSDGEDHAHLELTIEGPPGSFKIVSEQEVTESRRTEPELGSHRAIFTGRLMLPLTDYGVYTVSAQCGDDGEGPFGTVPRHTVSPSCG